MLAQMLTVAAQSALSADYTSMSGYERRSIQWPRPNTSGGALFTGANVTILNDRIAPGNGWTCNRDATEFDTWLEDGTLNSSALDKLTDSANCRFISEPSKLMYFADFFPAANVSMKTPDGKDLASSAHYGLVLSHIGLLENFNRVKHQAALGITPDPAVDGFTQVPILELDIVLGLEGSDVVPFPGMDESYSMEVKEKGANWVLEVSAETVFGVYNALSTFANSLEMYNLDLLKTIIQDQKAGKKANPASVNGLHKDYFDGGYKGALLFPFGSGAFKIENDGPKYEHRGIMIDTARSFYSVETMLKILSHMNATKLNVLHWHATDDQSFPLLLGTIRDSSSARVNYATEVKVPAQGNLKNPLNATEIVHGTSFAGAYSEAQTYDMTEVALIQTVAWNYGIRIVYEIDSPSHARSWGAYERAACSQVGFDDSNSTTDWNCKSSHDGPDSELTNMCWGPRWQLNDQVCVQQVCGPLNIKRENDDWTNALPISMFKAFYESLDRSIDEAVANISKVPAYSNLPANFETAMKLHFAGRSHVPADEYFHIGLDEVKAGCLDNYNLKSTFWSDNPLLLNDQKNTKARTSDSIQNWISALTEVISNHTTAYHGTDRRSKDLIIGWHDAMTHYPADTSVGVVPQVWDSTLESEISDAAFNKKLFNFQSLWNTSGEGAGNKNSLIWSPSSDTYLDCGLHNNAVAGFLSWCRPWKNFWSLYNTDPKEYAQFKREAVAGKINAINVLGVEAPLWGEQANEDNIVLRLFPRAAALAAPLWHGTLGSSIDSDESEINSQPDYANFPANNVLGAFDYTNIWSQHFDDEYEWVKWTYNMAQTGMAFMPEKTVYCSNSLYDGDLNCRIFGKSVYDFEAKRGDFSKPAPPLCKAALKGLVGAGLAVLSAMLLI